MRSRSGSRTDVFQEILENICSRYWGRRANGYLPIEKNERKSKIKNLEKTSIITTQIFMETPYRNNKFVSVLLDILKPETKLCIACDITLKTEYIKTKIVKEWKSTKIDINKRPAIFLIQSD